jgi:hypothetical protein
MSSARAAGIAVLLARSAYFAACDGDGAVGACDGLDSTACAARPHSRPVPRVDWAWLCDLRSSRA